MITAYGNTAEAKNSGVTLKGEFKASELPSAFVEKLIDLAKEIKKIVDFQEIKNFYNEIFGF